MKSNTAKSLVAGVVLAAGLSRRFSGARSKLLVELRGEPLVRRVVRVALKSHLGQVVVVGGHAAAEIRLALGGLDVEWVENPLYAEGQSTSVRAGLSRVASSMQAAVFLLADQPLVSRGLIDRLIAAWEDTGRPIVRPKARGVSGAPVLWDRTLFSELTALRGDVGGRRLITCHPDDLLEIEIEDPVELSDVDEKEDLLNMEKACSLRRLSEL